MMNTFDQIKLKATQDKIPSMQEEGLFFCEHLIQSQSLRNILEIGTGYGIWSIHMALAIKDLKIETIELNQKRAKIAIKNIVELNLHDRITVINQDALTVELTENYDLIFIDGPKSQNKALFIKVLSHLSKNGYILVDNLDFHGETHTEQAQSRDLKQLVRKINTFREWIMNESDLNVKRLDVGDGLLLISRKYEP
jgi:predicted O-methyltransferase YrrM